jgi:hypothetical protein
MAVSRSRMPSVRPAAAEKGLDFEGLERKGAIPTVTM